MLLRYIFPEVQYIRASFDDTASTERIDPRYQDVHQMHFFRFVCIFDGIYYIHNILASLSISRGFLENKEFWVPGQGESLHLPADSIAIPHLGVGHET